jgi:hypothetical protein
MGRLFKQTHRADWLTEFLTKKYPGVEPGVIRAAVEREAAFERAFQQKALKPVEVRAAARCGRLEAIPDRSSSARSAGSAWGVLRLPRP